jgi:hypothetical protein
VLISGKFEDRKTALSSLRHRVEAAPNMKAFHAAAV